MRKLAAAPASLRVIAIATAAITAICAAHAADVVVVERATRDSAPFVETVTDALTAAGIEFDRCRDSDVENKGALKPHKLAVFPYNGSMSDGEIAAIEQFVNDGGKIVIFYTIPTRLEPLLGIKGVGYVGGDEGRRLFRTVRFKEDVVQGLPPQMQQGSWNINAFEPLKGGADIVGTWLDADGNDTGYAAVSVGPNGVAMSHVLTAADAQAKAQFMLAVVGHYLPDVWPAAVQRAISRSERIGRFQSADELTAFCKSRGRMDAMRPALDEAKALRAQAQSLLAERRYPEAIAKAGDARAAMEDAYPLLYPAREGEMRAVWIHSPFHVDDWDEACRHLRDSGFNAVIVNMCNAGIAYYPSEYLKTADRAVEEGDQIARVLKACRKYGLELHVWRVNWRVSGNPEKAQRIKDEGISAVSYTGEKGDWLCPSWPQNHQHEVDAMLEIVRNYDVDGIHFDYIRYANSNYCYCDHCRKTFEKRIGKKVKNWPKDVREGPLRDEYLQFRRDCITSVVREVSEKSRAIKPWVKISAAVFGEWRSSRVSIGQDAKLWVDEGYLDFVCPMDYTNNTAYLGRLTEAQVNAVRGQVPLYIGIGAWRHRSVATFVDQIALARELGADGFVAFAYEAGSVRKYITATGRGITSDKTYMPHWAPEASFRMPRGITRDHATTYRAGRKLSATAMLTARTTLPQPVTRAWAKLELRDTSGQVLEDLGRLVAMKHTAKKTARFEVPAGRSRLVLDGREWLADGSSRRFVKRSAVMVGASEERIKEIKGIHTPPRIESEGVKVGVTANAYGAKPIIQALSGEPGIAAFPLDRLTPDFLKACDVVVLAQLRDPSPLTKRAAEDIRRWVRRGGRILLTHDAVGYRRHPIIFGDICSGAGTAESRNITIAAEHPVTAGMKVGDSFEHSYYDHIQLKAGPDAIILARDSEQAGALPVVVAAKYGKGKVVATGMVTGLADGDSEVAPTGGELKLLQNAIRWLAK